MCCFSRPVKSVTATNIFARPAEKDRQFLVYEMKFEAAEDVAMVLPLSIAENAGDDAVQFIDLSGYANFFEDMKALFPEPVAASADGFTLFGGATREAKLAVVNVGSFEASYVPSIADFSRLDERFRLPTAVWEQLPTYKSFGFAVFKLKAGNNKVHPMAFNFVRENTSQLFYPTLHIHDGTVPKIARFDHTLYAQKGEAAIGDMENWTESSSLAKTKVDEKRANNLVAGDEHMYARTLTGALVNGDTVLQLIP